MKEKIASAFKNHFGFLIITLIIFGFFSFVFANFFATVSYKKDEQVMKVKSAAKLAQPILPPLNTLLYDQKLNALANNPPPKEPSTRSVKDPKTDEVTILTIPPKPAPPSLWPVKTVYPNPGAILPFSRIVAFYGNLYSTKMGVLGEYPEGIMIEKLKSEMQKWQEADPRTPVQPALHYIAVVAQGSPGRDGKYRLRMPEREIEKVLKMAAKLDALVFLDLQVGFSTLQSELPVLKKYLELPQVHLGIDPEFSMKNGIRPGKVVGTFDAEDVNFSANFLAEIVRDNDLPPKILVVHRYTEKMVTNYEMIKTLPEVQIVMHMDGWGHQARKFNTYEQFIEKEPVQFTGFKLFYKNDLLEEGSHMLTPAEILSLSPRPIYIQYQ